MKLLPATVMGICLYVTYFSNTFLKKLQVSSNKYNWYRHFVYHFLFLNPIFLYKLDTLENVTKLNMILCFGLTSISMLLKCQYILNK